MASVSSTRHRKPVAIKAQRSGSAHHDNLAEQTLMIAISVVALNTFANGAA